MPQLKAEDVSGDSSVTAAKRKISLEAEVGASGVNKVELKVPEGIQWQDRCV